MATATRADDRRAARPACGRGGWLLAAVLSTAAVHAAADGGEEATAACIAVMQARADDLARQVRTGDQGQASALLAELQRAAALIGRAYLDGARDPSESKAKLNDARRAQSTWTEDRRRRTHQTCVKIADAELAEATGSQRFIVRRVAKAWFQRMLAAI